MSKLNQGAVLNNLALAYAKIGQSRRAISLLKRAIITNKDLKKQFANLPDFQRFSQDQIALGFENLSLRHLELGDLKSAYDSLEQSKKLYNKVKNTYGIAAIHQLLGQLFSYLGQFKKAERYVQQSIAYCKSKNELRDYCIDLETLARMSLLEGDPMRAFRYAEEMREKLEELEETQKFEGGIVRAEWLLGAAKLLLYGPDTAAHHLEEALTRCRRINLVELEARILLEHAKLALTQASSNVTDAEAVSFRQEAEQLAMDALRIADRCEYRLKQAEIHNFLAKLFLNIGDLPKARDNAEIATERASCGVDPLTSSYYYKPAYEEASRILQECG